MLQLTGSYSIHHLHMRSTVQFPPCLRLSKLGEQLWIFSSNPQEGQVLSQTPLCLFSPQLNTLSYVDVNDFLERCFDEIRKYKM